MAGLLLPYNGTMPRVAADAFIADGTQVIGDVDIASRANIWFNCVIRGDEHAVTIGANTNVHRVQVLLHEVVVGLDGRFDEPLEIAVPVEDGLHRGAARAPSLRKRHRLGGLAEQSLDRGVESGDVDVVGIAPVHDAQK